MKLFDKAAGLGQPSVREIAERQAPEIAQQIVSKIGPLVADASHFIDDDAKYLKFVATPLFRVLPPMIQLIGRERLKWDPIMLDIRDYSLIRSGGHVTVREDCLQVVVAVFRKHLAGESSQLLTRIESD